MNTLTLNKNSEDRIVHFGNLAPGWDYPNKGLALNPMSLKQLRGATMLQIPEQASVFMNHVGHLLVEWDEPKRNVCIEFFPDRVEIEVLHRLIKAVADANPM